MADTPIHQVVIIGGGTAGHTAAIYTARAGLEPIVFEGSVTAGGALYTTTDVENFPGFPQGIQGPELIDAMGKQAEKFGATYITDDIIAMDLTGEIKTLTDGDEQTHRARAVILATGSGYRHLNIPGEDQLAGHGISYCATCDGAFFKNKHLAVIGGGDSAMEEALFLTRFATTVTVVHRRDHLRASKIMQDRALNHPKIRFEWNSEPVQFVGDKQIAGILVRDTVTGDLRTLPTDGAFIAIGHDPRSELLAGQIDLDPAGYVIVDSPTTRTNQPGVFACGDLVDHTYRQAITAAGTGAAAALDAERYLAAHDQPAA
ncbi:thioredoxin-disulfide reductase [Actinospica sp. MGRD01-02]|uniref:Thioredoxin reductase n=1 Tax=Actinospica acidithermotolerans TaxID=2828514 RepID=A0A941EDY2_9ACTN|nr:thioredoxin-disulfide reductase [Actinospica acidithermotolerans]MBR7828712.1 thioredoxin-disulfide reductase [Actinospica acidithermotolerans]